MDEMLVSVKEKIDQLLNERDRVMVAIDGNCAAGKTTLSAVLENEYDCNVFHMDDFFLRPEQRTAERYAQPGGNVDYERFQDEVLQPVLKGIDFSYRPFSCKTFSFCEPIAVTPKRLTIVEGTYSLHPYFGDVYDWKVFLAVDAQLQRSRILERPKHVQERFFSDWIPMEQQYFDYFRIAQLCDVVYE